MSSFVVTRPAVRISTLLTEAERDAALLAETAAGLAAPQAELSPRWLYDERGSLLFEEITRLPEYYVTRREREILAERAAEIATLAAADTLVELGSGSSEKTRLLLGALAEQGDLETFVPLDVSGEMLRSAATAIAGDFPGLAVHGVVGDFERHLALLPDGRRRLVAFLGSTVGNFPPARRHALLAGIASVLGAGDTLLLGVDLVKEVARLEAAYDDAAGVTRAFTMNVLDVLNARLGADFDPGGFEAFADWSPAEEWIELGVRSLRAQRVSLPGLGLELELELELEPGQRVRTEVSCKFRRARLEAELADAGLELTRYWTDRRGDFAVCLARRA